MGQRREQAGARARLASERPLAAIVDVDGSDPIVNLRLVLRAGSAVVGLWNEAFDLDGRPPGDGTTVPGVQRVLKADAGGNNAPTDARKGATP